LYAADLELFQPSWGSLMSAAIVDDKTRIRRVPGKYTYMLLASSPESAAQQEEGPAKAGQQEEGPAKAGQQEEGPTEAGQREEGHPAAKKVILPQEATVVDGKSGEPSRTYTKREAALYVVLRDWLVGRGYQAKVASNAKTGGTWGNPDVAGIKITEGYLGRHDIEIATVEAKVSMTAWRQWIFEAVAHKRFAHRAYFAFAFGSDEPGLDRIPDVADLRKYAERYRVGVLVVFMPTELFTKLSVEKYDSLQIDSTEGRVEELWPAINEAAPLSEVVDYLWNVLGVATTADLYAFGDP
jgi:hypothetical protein